MLIIQSIISILQTPAHATKMNVTITDNSHNLQTGFLFVEVVTNCSKSIDHYEEKKKKQREDGNES